MISVKRLPEVPTIILLYRGLGRAFLSRSHAQKLTAMLQLLLAVSIAEEPVVANAVEPTRQNVEQEKALLDKVAGFTTSQR
jgi:hypothetical protein